MRNSKFNNSSYGKKPYSNKVDIMGDEIRQMYKATCDNCGRSCEVPFRPSNNKPVYCNDCFSSMKDKPDTSRRSDGWNAKRSNFDTKMMFKATCDECGRSCDVPFKPSNGKPVYCSDCFEKKGNISPNRQGNNDHNLSEQLRVMNTKLDKLIELLTARED